MEQAERASAQRDRACSLSKGAHARRACARALMYAEGSRPYVYAHGNGRARHTSAGERPQAWVYMKARVRERFEDEGTHLAAARVPAQEKVTVMRTRHSLCVCNSVLCEEGM